MAWQNPTFNGNGNDHYYNHYNYNSRPSSGTLNPTFSFSSSSSSSSSSNSRSYTGHVNGFTNSRSYTTMNSTRSRTTTESTRQTTTEIPVVTSTVYEPPIDEYPEYNRRGGNNVFRRDGRTDPTANIYDMNSDKENASSRHWMGRVRKPTAISKYNTNLNPVKSQNEDVEWARLVQEIDDTFFPL